MTVDIDTIQTRCCNHCPYSIIIENVSYVHSHPRVHSIRISGIEKSNIFFLHNTLHNNNAEKLLTLRNTGES